jgi:hypothetical protein
VSVSPLTLTDADLDALADRVAARLARLLEIAPDEATAAVSEQPAADALVDAQTVAAALGVDRKTVYRRRAELGGVKVGGAVRFDLVKALAGSVAARGDRSSSERSEPAAAPAASRRGRPRKRAVSSTHCQLLPVGRVEDR